jgi:hypothetical protein
MWMAQQTLKIQRHPSGHFERTVDSQPDDILKTTSLVAIDSPPTIAFSLETFAKHGLPRLSSQTLDAKPRHPADGRASSSHKKCSRLRFKCDEDRLERRQGFVFITLKNA